MQLLHFRKSKDNASGPYLFTFLTLGSLSTPHTVKSGLVSLFFNIKFIKFSSNLEFKVCGISVFLCLVFQFCIPLSLPLPSPWSQLLTKKKIAFNFTSLGYGCYILIIMY